MKILFFAPHSAIWAQGAFHEGLVAESLMQQGDEVIYVTCGRQFQGACVPMRARLMAFDSDTAARQKVCETCDAHKSILRREFGLQGYDLADKLTDQDRATVSRILSDVRQDSALDLKLDGLPVGRYAMYLFTINRKRSDEGFSDHEWQEYLTELANTLYAFYACSRILTAEKPDRVVVTNSIYSVNRVCTSIAESKGIPAYYLHAGGNLSNRLQSLIFARGHTYSYFEEMVAHWPKYRDLPCPASLARSVTNHFLELIKGRAGMVYSSAKSSARFNLRERFGIRPDQKILVAAMSSPDERRGGEITGVIREVPNLLFPDQLHWIRALIKYVFGRDDLYLIVRVHPREFPNKRDPVKSGSAGQLESAFTEHPANVYINWPSDNISVYDLAGEAAVFLTSWSSVGKEMSLLGIPVVIYSKALPLYAVDLNYCGETRAKYFAQIERALFDGWSIERTRQTYRWLALEYGYAQIDVSDSCTRVEYAPRNIFRRIVGRLMRTMNPYHEQERDCRNRPKKLKSGPLFRAILSTQVATRLDATYEDAAFGVFSAQQEEHVLRTEVQRLLAAFYPGQSDTCTLQRNLTRFAHPDRK